MCRKMACYRCAPARFAAYFQLGFVLDHDVFDNCQSKSRSPLLPGSRLIHPVESLSHTMYMLSRNSLSGIGHFQAGSGTGSEPFYADYTA